MDLRTLRGYCAGADWSKEGFAGVAGKENGLKKRVFERVEPDSWLRIRGWVDF